MAKEEKKQVVDFAAMTKDDIAAMCVTEPSRHGSYTMVKCKAIMRMCDNGKWYEPGTDREFLHMELSLVPPHIKAGQVVPVLK